MNFSLNSRRNDSELCFDNKTKQTKRTNEKNVVKIRLKSFITINLCSSSIYFFIITSPLHASNKQAENDWKTGVNFPNEFESIWLSWQNIFCSARRRKRKYFWVTENMSPGQIRGILNSERHGEFTIHARRNVRSRIRIKTRRTLYIGGKDSGDEGWVNIVFNSNGIGITIG